MKLVKVFVATVLALLVTHAMAFTPPYHISGTPVLGTATFKSAGACKVAPKKYQGAQFGSIEDSTNASVGTGVIDATGNHILAVANSTFPEVFSKYEVDAAVPKIHLRVLVSFVNPTVLEYIVAQSGCAPPISAWATPISYFDVQQEGSVAKLAIKQAFVGYLQPSLPGSCEQPSATVVKCNLKKFTGGMTFKGETAGP